MFSLGAQRRRKGDPRGAGSLGRAHVHPDDFQRGSLSLLRAGFGKILTQVESDSFASGEPETSFTGCRNASAVRALP